MPIFGIYVRFFGSYIFPIPLEKKHLPLNKKNSWDPNLTVPQANVLVIQIESSAVSPDRGPEKGAKNAETYGCFRK